MPRARLFLHRTMAVFHLYADPADKGGTHQLKSIWEVLTMLTGKRQPYKTVRQHLCPPTGRHVRLILGYQVKQRFISV